MTDCRAHTLRTHRHTRGIRCLGHPLEATPVRHHRTVRRWKEFGAQWAMIPGGAQSALDAHEPVFAGDGCVGSSLGYRSFRPRCCQAWRSLVARALAHQSDMVLSAVTPGFTPREHYSDVFPKLNSGLQHIAKLLI